jgi:hypothetical protein
MSFTEITWRIAVVMLLASLHPDATPAIRSASKSAFFFSVVTLLACMVGNIVTDVTKTLDERAAYKRQLRERTERMPRGVEEKTERPGACAPGRLGRRQER